ncbi:hypothetical protein LFU01_25120 [Lysinibacillus fusiformis]|nr:hypothetical protein LFU01_25120 [Lysinibacillus fusiformis]
MPISRSNYSFTISRELLEILTRANGTEYSNRLRNPFEEAAERWHPPLVLPPSPPDDNGDR